MIGRSRGSRRLLALLPGLLAALASAAPTDDQIKATYREILPQVRLQNLRQTYERVASFGPRLAGSKGEAQTLDFAEAELRRLGLRNVRRERFSVTVPDPEARGAIEVGGRRVEVLPLWPNLARTSTCDVSGPLIYGGEGTLESFKGLDVRGAIVVMEFDTAARWRNAAKLGAAAIVFVQPDEAPRGDAEHKFSGVPLDVPRFYLPLKHAGPVLAAAMRNERGRLACRQEWVRRESANLLADLPGSDPRAAGERVVLMAYADSMSVVPALSPGAEGIGGLATMLETARVWSQRPHRRPVTFVVSGAHGLALQGARELVERRIQKNDAPTLLTLTLDVSSGSRTVGSYGRGWFYEYRDESQFNIQSISRLLRSHADRMAAVMGVSPGRLVLTDAVNNGDARTWKNNIPGKFAFDCEPLVNAGMNALTLATIEDSRERTDTPFDTLDRVNLANVHRQAQTVACVLHHVLNDTTSRDETSDHRIPLEPARPRRIGLTGGFATVDGQVVIYDPKRSFVPDVKVPRSIAVVRASQKTLMGVRGDMLDLTGEDAAYRFVGLAPISSYPRHIQSRTRLAAFHLDPKTGRVDHAATWGNYGDYAFPVEFRLKTVHRTSPLVVFPCVAVDLFDLVDPQELKAFGLVMVLDAKSGSFPSDFGVFEPPMDARLTADIEDAQVLFLKPGQRFLLLGSSGPGEVRLVLTNSSLGDEAGRGYVAPGGPTEASGTTQGRGDAALSGRFQDLALNSARDLVAINATRLARFRKYRIVGAGIDEIHQQAVKEIALAEEAQRAKDWAEADRHARAAWGYALRAHPVIQKTAGDVVNGVVFYLFLLIPFSYFAERLFVGARLLTKQLGWGIGIFIGAFILLRLIHPAFEIISNPAMIFVAFVMAVLSLIVITFILGKFEASLKAVKQAQSGLREVDIRRASVAMAAFNLGVSNMRRRKARTFLTTLTLVVMTFIVLSFTSIVPELKLHETPSETPARYSGILMRNPGLEPMQLATYRQVANEFTGRGTVVRRAYYFGADVGESSVLTLQRADRLAEVRAMMGLEAGETRVARPQEALLPGGRWFLPGERNAILLPQPLAEALKVEPAEVGKAKVSFAGVDYTVVGILDPAILRSVIDLDGDGMLPPDFTLSNRYQQEAGQGNEAFRNFLRLDPATVFILPTETALALGAEMRTLAVSFEAPGETRRALDALMPRLRLNLYAAVPSGSQAEGGGDTGRSAGATGLEVRQFSVLQGSKGTGMGLILVQLAIAGVFVLNTMIASVYERTREIGIFSAIGLAPNHIAMLFFAESLVYGVLGAVTGYFAAQASAKIIVATGALPGLTLNFSSTSAVMSAGLVMAVVLGSTIYPARKASRIAAPAMSEEAFETEPEGDVWRLPLPFSIGTAEAAAVTAFLAEWLRAYEGYTIGEFVTAETGLGVEALGEADSSPQRLSAPTPNALPSYTVSSTMWLAPYDLGVSQRLELTASPTPVPGVYALDLTLNRLSGDPENWPTTNRRFLDALRKQFLTWRTLSLDERALYEKKAHAELNGETPEAPDSQELVTV